MANMIKTLLLPLIGEEADRLAVETAIGFARMFDAHMEFLYVRIDPVSMLVQVGAGDMGPGMFAPGLLEELETQERSRGERASQTFKGACERARIPVAATPPGPNGVSASWREITGDPVSLITEQARFSDIVVVGRMVGIGGLRPDETGTIIIGCGRPVLLAALEPPKQPTATVAIAWKNVPEAARAITAAMPLLRKAAKIVVFSVEEGQTDTSEPLERLVEHLRWHGFPADGKRVLPGGRPGPEALLAAMAEIGTDLLVMGAYGHNRIREMIFGGFTRRMLKEAPLPVLLFH